MSRRIRTLLALLLVVCAFPSPAPAKEPAFPFVSWSDAAFERARKERRVVLLMVSTSWCHWCHVMKRETYGNARVRALLARSFLPIYVDADARPDLAERFRNYRWPATAFLTPDAKPIVAIRGYRSPQAFTKLLQDVVRLVRAGGPYVGFEDPNADSSLPGPDDDGLRSRLWKQLERSWDPMHFGWGRPQKYPLHEPIEYGYLAFRSRLVGGFESGRARSALRAQDALLDREWGGVYQYSVGPGWDRWHPEKIMSVNAGALTNYAYARQLDNARLVRRWFRDFMTDSAGGFYTSQDADAPGLAGEKFYRLSAKERVRYGVPLVDRSIYARENGLAIRAHCAFAEVSQADESSAAAAVAVAAAERILQTHRNADGSFRHAARASTRLFLVDQAEMGRAFLALYALNFEARWLDAARETAAVIQRVFRREEGGFYDTTASQDPGVFAQRTQSLEANAGAARFLLDLGAVLGDETLRTTARRAIASVSNEERVRGHWRYIGGLLLAVRFATARQILRIDVRGADDAVQPLLSYARRMASDPFVYVHRTVNNSPPLAILCSNGVCSEPAPDPAALYARIVAAHGEDAAAPYEGMAPTIR